MLFLWKRILKTYVNLSRRTVTLPPAFLYQNRPRRYCVLKGHITIICPHPLPLAVIGGTPLLLCPPFKWLITDSQLLFGWLIRAPYPFLERVTHHGPPPPLGSPSPWCLLQTGTPPLLGSAGGPPPPEKDDSSSDDELTSWRQLLYFDWMVQNNNERLFIMTTYFIFRVIGWMTHHQMMNGRHDAKCFILIGWFKILMSISA